MAQPLVQSYGGFCVGQKTAVAGTAFALLIPPFTNQDTLGAGTGKPGLGVTHITTLIMDTGSTAHTLTLLRPLNYTTFTAVAAAGQKVLSLKADPGIFSAGGLKYGIPNAQTAPSTADDAIAAGDYCVYQVADGSYFLDTANGSFSSGSLTMSTNVPTGGTLAGGLFWMLGIAGDTDPNSAQAHPQFGTTTSTRINITDPNGLWTALHAGDPMCLYDPNSTVADTVQLISGYYAKH